MTPKIDIHLQHRCLGWCMPERRARGPRERSTASLLVNDHKLTDDEGQRSLLWKGKIVCFNLASLVAFILIFSQLANGISELEYTNKLPFGVSFDQNRLRDASALVISTSNIQTSILTPSTLA